MKQYAKENTEYKIRVIFSVMVFSLALALGLLFSGHIIKLLELKAPFAISFINLSPDAVFIACLKIAVFFGLYLSSPVILYNIYKIKFNKYYFFNKKLLAVILSASFLLFTSGILFAYYILIPLALFLLLGFNSSLAEASFSISSYTSFCLSIMLFAGMLFEFPVFLFLLARTNFITSQKLVSLKNSIISGAIVISIIINSSELFTILFEIIIILALYYLCVITANFAD